MILRPGCRLSDDDVLNRLVVCFFLFFELVVVSVLGSYARTCTVFSILVTVRLYTVMPEVCRWLTNDRYSFH